MTAAALPLTPPRPTGSATAGTRVVVAMSGGVDSSVAAALLAEQGVDVVGLSMQLYEHHDGHAYGGCCTLQDLNDARRVASRLGVPHYILNLEERFHDTVVRDFVAEYAGGRTPLPCAHCNTDLKFSSLLERAGAFGARQVASGHYARLERSETGRWRLLRGLDASKDQSYFLFGLTQAQLAGALFPVGGLSKLQVREHASRLGLEVAGKPDSQEICFVPAGGYASFVDRHLPEHNRTGAIRTTSGEVVGRHGGVHHFTIGQRKGLGLSTGTPLYVVHIDAETRDVTVGPRDALERVALVARQVNWIAIDPPSGWVAVSAQIRYRHAAAPARVRALEGGLTEVQFDAPQAAITPGQAVVFYDGEAVVGGGWIQ
jgi:tRNA-specific 2-thiouridylase